MAVNPVIRSIGPGDVAQVITGRSIGAIGVVCGVDGERLRLYSQRPDGGGVDYFTALPVELHQVGPTRLRLNSAFGIAGGKKEEQRQQPLPPGATGETTLDELSDMEAR